jgi:hypothetical protein
VFDQDADETLQRTDDRAVQHDGHLAVLSSATYSAPRRPA